MASGLVQESKNSASKAVSKVVHDVKQERDKTFSRPSGTIRKKDDPVEELVRIAASGIGFVSEAIHYRKEKKKLQKETPSPQFQPSEEATIPERMNEAIWELDDAGQQSTREETKSESPKKPTDVAKAFIEKYPYHPDSKSNTKLTLPVVLAQRRPKTRARGFVRAYAPVLGDVGINQEIFLDFIDALNQVLGPSPYLNAINLAGFVGEAIPDPFSILVGIGAELATDAAMEAQSRSQSNKFLDCMNAEFFAPRGLICLVITWKPSALDEGIITTVDFEGGKADCSSKTSSVQKTKDAPTSKTARESVLKRAQERMQERLKPNSGAFEWLEVAPLTFPSLDKNSTDQIGTGDAKKKKGIDRAEKWLDEYMDSSAQAKWLGKNPDHAMANALPKPEFRSRYADPNHPASSGDVVAFLTGGRWQYGHGKPATKEKSDDSAEPGNVENQKDKPKKSKGKTPSQKDHKSGSSTAGIMNLLQKDILYLVILNLPSLKET